MFSPSGSSFLLLSVFDLNENFDQDFFLQKNFSHILFREIAVDAFSFLQVSLSTSLHR